MSPRFGTDGQWCDKTADGNASTSANHVGDMPRGPHATEADSMPLHTLPYVTIASPFLVVRVIDNNAGWILCQSRLFGLLLAQVVRTFQ